MAKKATSKPVIPKRKPLKKLTFNKIVRIPYNDYIELIKLCNRQETNPHKKILELIKTEININKSK